MSQWGCEFSFGVDNGELDGIRPCEIFVLGYELALVREVYAVRTEGGTWPVHSANQDRIRRALTDKLRTFRLTYMADDPSESWMNLTIEPIAEEE